MHNAKRRVVLALLAVLLLLTLASPAAATGSINDPELGLLWENSTCVPNIGCHYEGTHVTVDSNFVRTYSHGWKLYVDGRYVGDLLGLADTSVPTTPVWNYVPMSNITWWATQLNGNPTYIATTVPRHLLAANGRTSYRVHIRDLARYAGGSVDGWDNITRTVWASTTPLPSGTIPDLPPQREGSTASWTITIRSYATTPGISSYKFEVNGVQLASGKNIPTSLYTFTASYTWPGPGTYTLTLTVTDQVQRSTVITKTVNVAPLPPGPLADFDLPPTTEVGKPVQVVDRSKAGAGATLVRHDWSVSPGTYTGSLSDTGGKLTFHAPGTYAVSLTVTDNYGRTDSATKQITVTEPYPPLQADASLAPNPAPSGARLTLTVNTTGYADQVQVQFPDDPWFHGDLLDLTPAAATSNDRNTWTNQYLTDLHTPDGTYDVLVIARRTRAAPQTVEIHVPLQIEGTIYDRIRVRIRSHGLPGDMQP